jgi:hypothetical protein
VAAEEAPLPESGAIPSRKVNENLCIINNMSFWDQKRGKVKLDQP